MEGNDSPILAEDLVDPTSTSFSPPSTRSDRCVMVPAPPTRAGTAFIHRRLVARVLSEPTSSFKNVNAGTSHVSAGR